MTDQKTARQIAYEYCSDFHMPSVLQREILAYSAQETAKKDEEIEHLKYVWKVVKSDLVVKDAEIAQLDAENTALKAELAKLRKVVVALQPFKQRLISWRHMLDDKTITTPISDDWLAVEEALNNLEEGKDGR